jgi:uncharacterized protein HemX
MNGWLPKLAAALAVMGIGGAIAAWGQQQGMKKDVKANGDIAKVCCAQTNDNEKEIAVIGAKFDAFKEQYQKDQAEARRDRQAILDAVKK